MLLLWLLLAQEASLPAPEPPQASGWGDFPVLVWREEHAGAPLPDELAEPFGGVILMREEDSSWARERGLAYLVWNVAGRDALHIDADEAWERRVERWIRTRDEELLVREPCLNDPRTVAELQATLERTLERHGAHPGLGFVLGDEVSLTPNGDPFDLCRCGSCETLWREHARRNGLPERAPLTDEVRLALLEDDFSQLGPWLARRRFDQERMQALLRALAERVRGAERPVALLGLKGRTAFGGVDPFAAAAWADVLEGYPAGAMPAILESLRDRRPDARRTLDFVLSTLFLAGESPNGLAWLAWESWLRGADALVLWSDEELARAPEARRRLAEAVARIRAVGARFPWHAEAPRSEVALVVDDDSTAVAWLRDALLDGPTWPRRTQGHQEENGTRERALRAWQRQADELGLALSAVPLAHVPRVRERVLVLPAILALGAEDVAHLEGYLDLGGTLVVDGDLGWVDRAGRPWRESLVERLRRRAPERVHLATAAGSAALLASPAARARARFTLHGAAAERPWLVRSASTHVGPTEQGVVLLPLAASSEERARLTELVLDVRSDLQLEWLHPAPGQPLPAGDAAVFLLRSGEPR